MFGFKSNAQKKAEQELAGWLAHGNEYGVAPKRVSHKRSFNVNFMAFGPLEVHLLDFEMPNGAKGRGFVNPFAFSFGNDELQKLHAIPDDDLLACYCGMAWLMNSRQCGLVKTDFRSAGEEARYVGVKTAQGFQNVQITDRYLIGESELFEYSARWQGAEVKGAGNTTGEVLFSENDPLFQLPAIYTAVGQRVMQP